MSRKHQLIIDHLNQLMDYTRQLSQCAEDPGIDTEGLSGKCREKLAELQAMMPDGVKSLKSGGTNVGAEADELLLIEELMATLDSETGRCIEILTGCRDRTAKELSSYRQTQKAIRAYNFQR